MSSDFRFPLQEAVLAGDLKLMEELIISNPACINEYDLNDYSALDNAVQSEHREAVRLLVKHKVDLNNPDEFGATSLHLASRLGHLTMIQELLACGADINRTSNSGRDALSFAITWSPHKDIIDTLIAGGINIDKYKSSSRLGYLSSAVPTEMAEETVLHLLKYPMDDENIKHALDLARDMEKHHIVRILEGHKLAKREQKILSEVIDSVKGPEASPTRSGLRI